MSDDMTISQCGIKESEFVVAMPGKVQFLSLAKRRPKLVPLSLPLPLLPLLPLLRLPLRLPWKGLLAELVMFETVLDDGSRLL